MIRPLFISLMLFVGAPSTTLAASFDEPSNWYYEYVSEDEDEILLLRLGEFEASISVGTPECLGDFSGAVTKHDDRLTVIDPNRRLSGPECEFTLWPQGDRAFLIEQGEGCTSYHGAMCSLQGYVELQSTSQPSNELTPSTTVAASFDCDKAATETEIAICADPELSALDELAGVLAKYVGLTVNFNEIEANYDDIADHYTFGINSLLGLIAQPHIASLMDDIANLSTWEAELYPRNVLIIRPKIYGLQEILIIFGERHYPLFVEMEHINSPFSFQYSIESNVLFVSMNANPASLLYKYRWQNDCWRLIGEDSTYNHRGYNPENDPVGRSINYLTGHAILSYDNGESIARTFDPEVWCIDEGKGSYSIDYHDGKQLD